MLNQFTASIWGDEGFSAILSMHTLPDIIKIIINDTSPPLWNICEWIVFHTLGTKEIYIRGLAFFFFLIAVFFTYKIGSFLWDRKTGILAASLTFLNPFFFSYAFEGRMYSIMSAGVAGSMYFFSRMVFAKEKVQKKHVLGYIAMTLWALYSHHFAFFAVIIQGFWFLYILATTKKHASYLFVGFLAVALGYIPWLWPLYHQIKMVSGGFWLAKPKIIDLIALVIEYLAVGFKTALAIPALAFVVVSLGIRKWNNEVKKSLFVGSWFLGPIIMAFLISQVFSSIFYNRYLLYAIPAVCILLASLGRNFSKITIAIVIILFLIIDFNYFTHPAKLPFRDLAAYIQTSTKPGDYLINWNSNGSHHLWETKYYGLSAPIYVEGKGDLPYFIGTALMEPKDLVNEIPKDTKRVVAVTTGPSDEIKIPGFFLADQKDFSGAKVIWLTPTKKK